MKKGIKSLSMLLFLLVFVGIFGVKSLAAENYIPGNVAKLTGDGTGRKFSVFALDKSK